MKVTILGTGHATVTKCYNTCFTISENGKHFLVDAGGGNGILTQLENANINIVKIKTVSGLHVLKTAMKLHRSLMIFLK